MIFKYGNYAHAMAEVGFTSSQRPVFSARGFKQATRHTWNLQGILHADNPQQVTTAVNNMQAAYSIDGQNAAVYLDDGTTLTHLVLDSALSIGGVRVTQLSFPNNGVNDAEYTTYRTYSIQLEADFPHTEVNLLSFNESLSFSGTGGPRDIFMPVLTGLPQKQRVFQRTVQKITQQGSAIGYLSYPPVPPPIWPAAEIQPERRISLRSPKTTRGTATDFAIDWQYTFETAVPQAGIPNVR